MRAVIQRITSARVVIEGKTIGEVGKGLLVFLGIKSGDDETAVSYLVDKIINLRIFEDEQGKMNLSLKEVGGEILVVSQFTLYADCRKGRRPSFQEAAKPEISEKLYLKFIKTLRDKSLPVATGSFGADMKVELVNNGPVTILLDSKDSGTVLPS
ncbi:MAG TPA: D-tyrosyl-tRNA(Tyr) deacylase [Firmicutes bacterium]|jgi:D-tyrosyl-tRNA(Tyr) deacylase|nr:D-tyrosyl-tRNA(Tyr) deacylase [Bacillota bacterium]HBT17491.1 D-tyrosyl-tRNA(Tyr) deacylase [Bacillota bacterium]